MLTHPHSSHSAFPCGIDFPGGESTDTPNISLKHFIKMPMFYQI